MCEVRARAQFREMVKTDTLLQQIIKILKLYLYMYDRYMHMYTQNFRYVITKFA